MRSRKLKRGNPFTLLGSLAVVACSGQAAEKNRPGGDGDVPGDSADSTSSSGYDTQTETGQTGTGGSAGGDSNGDVPSMPETCPPSKTPLRRLSRYEYNNSVRELLGDTTEPGNAFPQGEPSVIFENNVDDQSPTAELITAYFTTAKDVARRATQAETVSTWLPCAATVDDATVQSCAEALAEYLTSRAFRRAAPSEEQEELTKLHAAIMEAGGSFLDATAGVIAAVLQSPDFLYRVELGVQDPEGSTWLRPSGEEMAARLSFLLWESPPDATLSEAAESGDLLTAQGIEAQAERLLAHSRSHATVARFFDQWLRLDAIGRAESPHPELTVELAHQLQTSTQLFFEAEIFKKNASWPEIWTSPDVFVNDAVAPLYGVSDIAGSDFQETVLGTLPRLGFLTHPAVLSAATHFSEPTNPDARGRFILDRLLCRTATTPHPMGTAPVFPAGVSAREAWESSVLNQSDCAACHTDSAQLGFTLQSYDALGRHRTTENGLSIDTQIEFDDLGTVNDGVDLVSKLATLPETQSCFVQRWLEFSLGRELEADDDDQCLKDSLTESFEASGHNVQKLLIDLTQTEAFLYLGKEGGEK